jgi:trk system potassium uptake protein
MFRKWNCNLLFKTIGQILLYSSFTLLLPVIFSIIFSEPVYITILYLISFLLCFLISLIWYKTIKIDSIDNYYSLNKIHYLIIICLVWLIYSAFSSLPFMFAGSFSFIDSYFEVISALTTTGLSIFPQLNILNSLILWRSILSWIGGIGIILIAYFGLTNNFVNTNKLIDAEGHSRLRPNFKKTLKDIWIIYIILTVIGIILLFLFGMSFFDSINYSMSAISTTGMDSSVSGNIALSLPGIQLSLIIIMLLGATSFITHYSFLKKKSYKEYYKDKEFLLFLLIIFIGFILVLLKLFNNFDWISILFNIVSLITGGGFTNWSSLQILSTGPFVLLIFMILMFIGGSTNSTTGGIKVNRIVLFIKSIFWKIKSVKLPDIAYFSKKHNNSIVENKDLRNLYFFILMYLLFIILGTIVLGFYGYGIKESLFEVLSAQGNVGVSVGIVQPVMPLVTKIMLIINMWVGRLEIIPILGLLSMLLQKRK